MGDLLSALEFVASGATSADAPNPSEEDYEQFQAMAEALVQAGESRLVYSAAAMRSRSRETYNHVVHVVVNGGLTPEGRASLATLRHQAAVRDQLRARQKGRIFISYRRADSADVVGRICDRMDNSCGKDSYFRDVDSIELGRDFRERLAQALQMCDVMLAIIGPSWISVANPLGERRLDDESDFVRLEIETALQRGVRCVPVLVGGASLPLANQLPPVLQALAYRQAIEVRGDPHFHKDVAALFQGIGREA